MIWILKNWAVILSSMATAALSYMLHSLDVNRIESNHRQELSKQATALNNECAKDKAITEGVSNEYQKHLGDLNKRYNALRVQHSRCVAVSTSGAPYGHNATPTGGLSKQNGVTSESLLEFARDCEQVRGQLIGCQSFLKKIND